MTIRTRFAPSPTGYLHIGGARTALYAWLYARQHGGQFILRIEDTDQERSSQAAVQAILDSMQWLQLEWDEGPFFQTQRMARYHQVLQQLLQAGKAYPCYCSKERLANLREQQMAEKQKPRYDGHCRAGLATPPAGVQPVIRFKNPAGGDVVFDDLVYGRISVSNQELDDLVIARPDGMPTYNFTVVVDDYDMRISHVIRGDDHINNTPRQINILEAMGARLPVYAHVPMILGEDGKRLSKRHGAVSVTQYRDDGYLPEALLNYLVRLGWSHGDQEIFSRQELLQLFDLNKVNRAAAVFNGDKLRWLNQQYLKQADGSRLATLLAAHLRRENLHPEQGPDLRKVVEVQRERVKTLVEMAEGSAYLFTDLVEYDSQAAAKQLTAAARAPLLLLKERLSSLEDWSAEKLHDLVKAVVEASGLGFGKVAQPLRFALTGGAAAPNIDQTLELIGRERSLQRIEHALDYIALAGGLDLTTK